MIDKRMMYAQGQRVAKTLDGSRPGYRGSDMAGVGTDGKQGGVGSNTSEKDTSGADYGGGNQGRDAATSSGVDDRSSDTQKYNHYEAISKNTGIDNNPLRPSGIEPGFIKPGDIDNLALSPYEQRRVDFLNTPYKPMNIPLGVPGGMLLNTVGNFLGNIGHKKNSQFFVDNVAGKYGFGYGLKDYQKYMEQRSLGNVGAYGNENMGQNAINARSGGDDGIMDVAVSDTTDDTTNDTNEDGSLILRFLHDNPQEVVNLQAMGVKDTDEMLQVMLDRAKNLYTT